MTHVAGPSTVDGRAGSYPHQTSSPWTAELDPALLHLPHACRRPSAWTGRLSDL